MSGDAITTAATANSLSAVRSAAASRHMVDHQVILQSASVLLAIV